MVVIVEVECSTDQWTWKFREWMKVDIVDSHYNLVNDELNYVVSRSSDGC